MTTASADQTTVFETNVVQIGCAVLAVRARAVAVRPMSFGKIRFYPVLVVHTLFLSKQSVSQSSPNSYGA